MPLGKYVDRHPRGAECVLQDRHVRAFDQRGHGETQWAPDKDYSRDAMMRDMAAMVRGWCCPPSYSLDGLV